MTISLPLLWILGHLAAMLGVAMAGLHLCTKPRAVIIAGLPGGAFSATWLAYILAELDQSFNGLYRWQAWVVAFFAGYACGAFAGLLTRGLVAPIGRLR